MKFTAKNDDGVSPVIGTILLVAITVVLVAIVAAVVMGMVGSVQSTKDVGVTVESWANSTTPYGHGVTVLVYGGNDVSNLRSMSVVVDGEDVKAALGPKANNTGTTKVINNPAVGEVYKFVVNGTGELTNRLVIVRGNFSDGTTSVLAQTSLTIPKSP